MRNRSGLLTFCFALIPGAGQMYLGMMRKGTAVMAAFWGLITFAGFFQLNALMVLSPVIWCYSFFDTLNSRWLSEEQRQALDSQFHFRMGNSLLDDFRSIIDRRHLLIGLALIVLGGWSILHNLLYSFSEWIPSYIWRLIDRAPSLFANLAIIGLGIWLVAGKKNRKEINADFVEYKGEDENNDHE